MATISLSKVQKIFELLQRIRPLFTVLRTERKMARRFAKVSEEEIEEAFFYPSDLVNTKTTIPLRVGEERWIRQTFTNN